MASENYLQDYYKQLPHEAAEFGDESEKNVLGDVGVQDETDDCTFVLRPEVISSDDSIESRSTYAGGDGLVTDMSLGGGHSSFEPVPAASFEPVSTHSATPHVPYGHSVVTENEVIADEQQFEEELEKDLSAMSCEKELPEQENLSPENEQQSFEPEAESLPLVLEDDKYEDEEDQEVVAEDTPAQDEEIEQISPPLDEPDVKEEVIPIVQVQGVEEIETKPAPVSLVSNVPVAVVDLVYWRDIKKTAFIFSFLLLILGSLVCFSVISVFAYAGLAFLTVTVAFRLYKLVLQTLNGTQQPHPFQVLLDLDLTLSQDHVQKYISTILCHLNCGVTAARNLFLVQNTISSLKFGVFLWLLTYIGSCFNGLTVLIIDVILVFTLPPVYEKYQTQIDNYCGIARKKVCELMATAKAKLPGAKKQPKEKAQ